MGLNSEEPDQCVTSNYMLSVAEIQRQFFGEMQTMGKSIAEMFSGSKSVACEVQHANCSRNVNMTGIYSVRPGTLNTTALVAQLIRP